MKIKTWLLLSYLIVMVLPLICAYGLFLAINNYYETKKVEENIDIQTEIRSLSNLVRDASLYKGQLDTSLLEDVTNEQKQIKLYNEEGVVLYATVREAPIIPMLNQIYSNLYEVEEKLHAFTYKEPVFDQGELVGIFEIKVARDDFVATMQEYSAVVISLFIITFALIYAAVAYFIHQKINRRLNGLMDEMSAFASGNFHAETKTKNDEIGALQKHFYAMRRQITEAQARIEREQEEKEYMIAAISHDLKTPLTAIKAYTEALQEPSLINEAETKKYQKIILDKADFMKKMLDDLMVYSLLQSQDYRLDLVTVDGRELFDMLLSDYEAICQQKNIHFTAINDVSGSYEIDVKEMIRVVDNLMSNAIQHTESGKSLDLLAFSSCENVESILYNTLLTYDFHFESYAYLVVQNEGAEMDEASLAYLFEPLYQADQARSKKDAHGAGLGLSITKQIIHMHGGSIDVFTEENKGIAFICAIPKKNEG